MRKYQLSRLVWFGIIPFLALGTSQIAHAQDDKSKRTESTKRVVRPEGWSIPKVKTRRIGRTSLTTVDGVQMQGRVLEPVNRIVTYEDFLQRPNGDLFIRRSRNSIVAMSELSVGGRVFAYAIRYGFGDNVGGVSDMLYLDEDGDGTFEVRFYSIGKPPIPKWVKTLK